MEQVKRSLKTHSDLLKFYMAARTRYGADKQWEVIDVYFEKAIPEIVQLCKVACGTDGRWTTQILRN